MTRFLQFLNLAGVLALGVLCAAQWQDNRQFNQEINRLEAIRLNQSNKLDERDKTITGQRADLDSLHEHLTRLSADHKETEVRLAATQREVMQLEAEREQLKESVKKWAEAVAERDGRIGENQDQIGELARRLHETVAEYNQLATNYNASVKLLNERTAAYNDLIAKYNELAKK